MTKMAATPIYGKTLPRTRRLMTLGLGICEAYQICPNDDPMKIDLDLLTCNVKVKFAS